MSQAICAYRKQQGHRRTAVSRLRYACAVGAGVRERARGTGRERRRSHDRRGRRIHADAGDFACDSQLQPRPPGRTRGRHRHHAVAQSARQRRLQIQPAERRTRRHEHHGLDRDAREPAAAKQASARSSAWATPRRASAATTHAYDYLGTYVAELGKIIDLDVIRDSKVHMGVDPSGRRGRALLGAHRRTLWPESRSRQRTRSIRPFAS